MRVRTNLATYIVDYSQAVPDHEPPHSRFEHPTNRYQQSNRFIVAWHADDPGNSGVDYYDLPYREVGQAWQDWLRHTTQTSTSFLGQEGKISSVISAFVNNSTGPKQSVAEEWHLPDCHSSATLLKPIAFLARGVEYNPYL